MSAKKILEQTKKQVTMFTPVIRRANKHHDCDGCGECPINEGDTYMEMKSRDSSGHFHRRRYCIRCCLAIELKKAYAPNGSFAMAPGDLKLSKLSSKFRKAWEMMVNGIREAQQEGDEEKSRHWTEWFQNEIGIHGIGATKSQIERVQSLLAVRRERRESAKTELKQLRQQMASLRKTIAEIANKLEYDRDAVAKARLAKNIAEYNDNLDGMVKGDEGIVSGLLAIKEDIDCLKSISKGEPK